MTRNNREELAQIVQWLREGKKAVAFTGAGISVESGIPDFRSSEGIWSKYPLEKYGTREAFERDPEEFWKFFFYLAKEVARAEPNPAHYVLAQLEKTGQLTGVVTQNIDGLHQRAGTQNLAQLHGRPDWLHCVHCYGEELQADIPQLTEPPRCRRCGRILKPDVVLFGDLLPQREWQKAQRWILSCDLLFVIGTSGMVEPAASLPWLAKERGVKICQFDLHPNVLTSIADVFVGGPAGETLAQLGELLSLPSSKS